MKLSVNLQIVCVNLLGEWIQELVYLFSHFLENDFHLCIVMDGNNHSVLYLPNSGSNYGLETKKVPPSHPRYVNGVH